MVRYITDNTTNGEPGITRLVGLLTALANPDDLADWIGIGEKYDKAAARIGLYNFRPAVRPIPMKVHTVLLFQNGDDEEPVLLCY